MPTGTWAPPTPEYLTAPGYETYAPTAAYGYSPTGGDWSGGFGSGGGGGLTSGGFGGGTDNSTLGGLLSAASLLGGANDFSSFLTGKSLMEHADIPNPLEALKKLFQPDPGVNPHGTPETPLNTDPGFFPSDGGMGTETAKALEALGYDPASQVANSLVGEGFLNSAAALSDKALMNAANINAATGSYGIGPGAGELFGNMGTPGAEVLQSLGIDAGFPAASSAASAAAPGIASGTGMLGGGGGMTSAQHAAFSNMGGGGGLLGLGAGAGAFALAAPMLAYYGITSMQADESPAETRAQQVQAGQVFDQAKDFIMEHGRVPGPEDGWHGNIDHLLRMMAPGGGGGISATVGADLQRFGNGVPNEVLGRAFSINDPEGNIVLNHLAQETDMIGVDPGVRALINSRNIDTTPSLAFEGRMQQDIGNRFTYPELYGAVTPYLQNAVGHDKQPLMETVYDEHGAVYQVPANRPAYTGPNGAEGI